jgi:hypothetical protein
MINDFKYGDRVKASNDTICWWYGTYIAKHPKNDTHVVLVDANSNFRQDEKVETYKHIQYLFDQPKLDSHIYL